MMKEYVKDGLFNGQLKSMKPMSLQMVSIIGRVCHVSSFVAPRNKKGWIFGQQKMLRVVVTRTKKLRESLSKWMVQNQNQKMKQERKKATQQ